MRSLRHDVGRLFALAAWDGPAQLHGGGRAVCGLCGSRGADPVLSQRRREATADAGGGQVCQGGVDRLGCGDAGRA
jgi:hypothetical protein